MPEAYFVQYNVFIRINGFYHEKYYEVRNDVDVELKKRTPNPKIPWDTFETPLATLVRNGYKVHKGNLVFDPQSKKFVLEPDSQSINYVIEDKDGNLEELTTFILEKPRYVLKDFLDNKSALLGIAGCPVGGMAEKLFTLLGFAPITIEFQFPLKIVNESGATFKVSYAD